MKFLHAMLLVYLACAGLSRAADDPRPAPLVLHARQQVKTADKDPAFRTTEAAVRWDGPKTAVIVCDMWDQHWCAAASRKVAETAPRVNRLLIEARRHGALVVHAPSGTMAFYKDAPGRKLAQQAPRVEPKVPLKGWCRVDPTREPPLPIDDSDGGCPCEPKCRSHAVWTRQIAAIEIQPGDAIADDFQIYYLIQQRGIENVMLLGVHLNMCVLGRPFGIRQMVAQGKHVVLVRDLTDTMYNPRRPPHVSHDRGTELMIEHVERYWCPTIAGSDLVADK